jgi:hypothetical protein
MAKTSKLLLIYRNQAKKPVSMANLWTRKKKRRLRITSLLKQSFSKATQIKTASTLTTFWKSFGLNMEAKKLENSI